MEFFKFSEKLTELSDKALKKCEKQFKIIEENTEYNQQKVLKAFIDNKVSESHFTPSTGYGYGDRGRDVLDSVVAQAFGGEDALMRCTLLASGTHTLTVTLFGLLRPGDTMLCVTGTPYDTIRSVIGIAGKPGNGSLKDFGITYREVDLLDGHPDLPAIAKAVAEIRPRLVYIQRSRGYTLRPSLSVDEIDAIAVTAKNAYKDTWVMVDNCYGEFVEKDEPVARNADIMAGSLIKNPGGGIAPGGGYVCGKKEPVELVSYRMTTAGTGREVGASLGTTRDLFMGFFSAPHVTGEALKTAVFTAALFDEMGFRTTPAWDEPRHDIIQALCLENADNLCAFCRGLQSGSPVDSFVTPEPWDMPGYDSQVIMAAGAFTNGSSIELSADAPLRDPFAVWMQGSLNFACGKTGILLAAEEVGKVRR